jgi:hypothetical protein
MSIDGFSKATKEVLSAPNEERKEPQGLINKALQSKVPVEKINAIIAEVYAAAGNYTLKMGINKVRSAIENNIRAANATELKGILVGSRDVVGRQIPNKYTLIRADKKHLEIGSFDSQVPYQGGKIDIPVPAGVVIKAEYDGEYDSWSLISIEQYQLLNAEKLLENLSKVVIPISAIDEHFAYHKIPDPTNGERAVSARPVVIYGEISRVSPEAIFAEKEDGTFEISGHQPVMCPRELKHDETLPCIQFLLNSKTRGVNTPRCHLSQQRKGTPTILIEDLVIACEEAVKKSKDPEIQAGSVSEDMRNWPVLVVGTVSKFNKGTGQDKQAQNWIDIGVTCIIDADAMDVDGTGVQKKLPDTEKPTAVPATHATDSPPVAGPIQSSAPPAASETRRKRSPVQKAPEAPLQEPAFPAPAATPANPPETVSPPPAAPAAQPGELPEVLRHTAAVVSQYAALLQVSVDDISIEVIKTKMRDAITMPDGKELDDIFIKKIIDYLKAGGKV